jgi:hypothetical protein
MGENLLLDIGMQRRPVAFDEEEEQLKTMDEEGARSCTVERVDEGRDVIVNLYSCS